MAGGLLNLVSEGNQNIILNSNPKKTFFKTSFQKYTNFGLQKFRIDKTGSRGLALNSESKVKFKIPRYGDLLMDTYIVVTIPDIWSSLYKYSLGDTNYLWVGHDFKWIKNLGTLMIKEVDITIGGQTVQKYSGAYLLSKRERNEKPNKLYDEMTGNVNELNNPCNSHFNNFNSIDVSNIYHTDIRKKIYGDFKNVSTTRNYPNAIPIDTKSTNIEPSIRGRKLYIPLGSWFSNDNKMAFPLVALQYSEMEINITFRPISELFVVRDVLDVKNNFPYVKPNFNETTQQIWRFLQQPQATSDTDWNTVEESYNQSITDWDDDIHLISTYCFLSEDERRVFAVREHDYLIKDVREYKHLNLVGSSTLELDSANLVSDLMFYLQRSDINLRNEWSNMTNWSYDGIPEVQNKMIPENAICKLAYHNINFEDVSNNLFYTGAYNRNNKEEILQDFAIILDGKYREESFDSGIFNYIEKYSRSNSHGKTGLYTYSFGVNTDYEKSYQPSGAINLAKFSKVELKVNTIEPPIDVSAVTFVPICDDSGNIIGINKPKFSIYEYNYDLTVFEERYNILKVISGNAGLYWSR